MAQVPKTGPLTAAELLNLWQSVVDPGYSEPILSAGEGEGLEVITQAAAVYERQSVAVDRTTQAMFVLPWSGQTNPPAGGGSKAEVDLTITRTTRFERPLILGRGLVQVEEVTTDASPSGPIEVRTKRKYTIDETLFLPPGAAGPVIAPFVAELPGYGYNNPPAGNLRSFVQPNASASNDGAAVVPGVSANRLVVKDEPDVVVPEHVGRYVEFVAGSNAGRVCRITGYEPPDTSSTPPTGGVAVLAPTWTLIISALVGTFLPGEEIVEFPSGARAIFEGTDGRVLIAERVSGTMATTQVLAGSVSGAQALVEAIDETPDLVAETSATWRILDWELDLGLAATNEASPSGGRAPMLDELGAERKVFRGPGENDETYRLRVATPADVISPNAILRRANSVLAPRGEAACLREVGTPKFRGMFYDGNTTDDDPAIAFAYDLDIVLLTGVVTGQFQDGEVIEQQHADGTIAIGRAAVDLAGAAPGSPTPAPTLAGVVRTWGEFRSADGDVVGASSGASVSGVVATGGLQIRDRFKLDLGYEDFRAFFLVGVPLTGIGDFGIAYDESLYGAFDAYPYLAFFDGYPVTTATIDRAVWQAVDAGRAGGVGFDLYVETAGCT